MDTARALGGRAPPRAAPAMGSFQLEDFAAGWVGGAASVIVGYPLDTVKTRLQAGVGYRGTLHCIRTVYSRESVFGFFKGMSFPLASIAVYNSVVFGVFSNTQRLLGRHRCGEPEASPPRSLSDLLLASMVAGVVSVGLGGPVDLIKIRLQMQTQPFQEGKRWGRPWPSSRQQIWGPALHIRAPERGTPVCPSQAAIFFLPQQHQQPSVEPLTCAGPLIHLHNNPGARAIILSILQMRKLRLLEAETLRATLLQPSVQNSETAGASG